ncbi:outer membrane lipoprotein-sorting protein [Marispirochaeta aestuarii]|uniref:Outer membrane lipoprotein-sorting protein n=1 Tax=Marispirochaeta aestuarii TaxID=1963862 RepID=A0A1Y1RWR3_9SPIO|nr:outer membrane lipoprotein-sorting protein [Marispirochaeta aestuarii]ORC34632.1 outer membrane lipoprotein-sorting protein [Marispirochaeta aestuarii]
MSIMNRNRIGLILVAGIFFLGGAFQVFGNSFSLEESRRILSMVDALVSYEEYDFSGEYTIIDDKPGQGTSRTKTTIFRRDRQNTYTIIVMEPDSDKGKGYLRQGDMLWLYDPVPRRFTVTSARDRFQNSNARNSDFTKSTLAQDYRIIAHSTEKLGAYHTDVYDLEALTDEVSYPKMKIWIDQDNLVRKTEDYSLSGRHMRTTAILDYTRIRDRYVPVRIVIQDELRGREVNGQFKNYRTLISVAKPSFQELPDMVFTKAYIERVSN